LLPVCQCTIANRLVLELGHRLNKASTPTSLKKKRGQYERTGTLRGPYKKKYVLEKELHISSSSSSSSSSSFFIIIIIVIVTYNRPLFL
jgi:hypothetical protein